MRPLRLGDGPAVAVPGPVTDARPGNRPTQSRVGPGGHRAPTSANPPAGVGDPGCDDDAILALWDADSGWTVPEIAAHLGIDRAEVRRVVTAKHGSTSPRVQLSTPAPTAGPRRMVAAVRQRSPRRPAPAARVAVVELVGVPVLTRDGLREIARRNRGLR